MNNTLELKTIQELQEYKFYIPSYQRGYRWTPNEVEDLLNDISEFIPRLVEDSDEKTWYCLQPIVVKEKENGQFEVIDGQQRLTTIYLILHYMNSRYVEPVKLFELDYETRKNSTSFLEELTKDVDDSSNIDFFHIIMLPFFKTSKTTFLIPPHYDTDCNSFSPLKPKLLM